MLKFILALSLLYTFVFSDSMFSLDKVQNFKIHIINSAGFLNKEEEKQINTFTKTKLKKAGFIFDEIDPIILFIKIKSIEIDEELYVINIQLYLAEDVEAKRGENAKIKTFAYTYFISTMMESQDPYEDTLEAVNYLTCQLITSYKDDNE